MKNTIKRNFFASFIAALGSSFLLTGTPNGEAQTYKQDTVLAPSDLGIYKYSLSASPPKDKVMVFRQKKTVDGKDVDIFETISFTSGKEKIETVLLFRPSLFPYSTPEMQQLPDAIRTNSGGYNISKGFRLKQWSCGGEGVNIRCENDQGKDVVYSFVIEMESLSDAIKRIPALASNPSSDGCGWSYCASIKSER